METLQYLLPWSTGLLYGSWSGKSKRPSFNFLIDRFYSEGHIASLMAILIAGLPQEIWFNLKRIKARYRFDNDEEVEILLLYQGAFQAWLPLLFIPESKFSPWLKKMHENYANVQIEYAQKTRLYALRSASADPYVVDNYRYEHAIGIEGASEDWVRSDIGAPYATVLLYLLRPKIALKFLAKLLERHPTIKGPYGFYDAISKDGRVKKIYLSLDQLQILLSFTAFANRKYFLKFLGKEAKIAIVLSLYQKLNN